MKISLIHNLEGKGLKLYEYRAFRLSSVHKNFCSFERSTTTGEPKVQLNPMYFAMTEDCG